MIIRSDINEALDAVGIVFSSVEQLSFVEQEEAGTTAEADTFVESSSPGRPRRSAGLLAFSGGLGVEYRTIDV
ncbi:hypothetical protein DN402_05250 [Streptomyces sp. SW4]|nr:hypothetical protein DN402_34205 [Streptomyces sp. SW4]PZT71349.1 hypothetical protein DN402_05250 [Streptomyces sp. SW4]